MLTHIVTGTGRCGTLFMANLLTSMGFPCSHEGVFTVGGLGAAREVLGGLRPWGSSGISEGARCLPRGGEFVADSSYMAAPFLGHFDAAVIHVVRNPLNVVASLTGGFFRQFAGIEPTEYEDRPDHHLYEGFIYDTLPELGREMPQLDRACLFYVLWNEMIERSGKVSLFHRIEDDTGPVRGFFGFSGRGYYRNTRCNSVPERREWSPDELQDGGIRDRLLGMAARYGYIL